MIKFSKQLSLGASGVVLNFLNTSNWQSQTNTKTKTKSDHLENPGKPAAQSLGLYFMTFLQEGADKRALVIIDVSCVTNLQSHYFRHRWCRHQAADWGIYGQILSPTLIYFSVLPPVGQTLKHLEGSLMVQWGFKFTRRLNLTWCIFPIFGSKFGPKLSKEDSPDVPDTLSHATTDVWGCKDKTNFNPNLLVHIVKELYYMFTTASTIFLNSFQVHDTLFMYGWLMIESSSAEDLLHIWWWSTAAAFVRTGDGGAFKKKSFVCLQRFSQ